MVKHGGEHMIETIEPNVALSLAAMAGATFYHVAGLIDAKNADPNISYKYTYFIQTAITILMIAGLYQYAEIELTFFTVILAFISGLGGNAGASTLIRRKAKSEKPEKYPHV